METIIGTIIGGIIAGLAMILNSYFNSKISREKEERDLKRKNFQLYITALEKIYEDVLAKHTGTCGTADVFSSIQKRWKSDKAKALLGYKKLSP